ncbi:MAG: hypothetical protein CL867_08105 [Cytophagaceae bacterium]|nr:hypothetical protein [Cytophagaceae bacterium]
MQDKWLRRVNVADNNNEETKRTPRSLETRSDNKRPTEWKPPSVLPDPTPQKGWAFRWVRTSMTGQSDNTNVSMRFREGWEPVKAVDHPELSVIPDHESRFPGCVEVGGLLLCKAPEETAAARSQHYQQKAAQQMESVDQAYMRENDPRMPVLAPDRRSRTTFGRGGS